MKILAGICLSLYLVILFLLTILKRNAQFSVINTQFARKYPLHVLFNKPCAQMFAVQLQVARVFFSLPPKGLFLL